MRALFSGFIACAVGSPILAAFALSHRLVDLRSLGHGRCLLIEIDGLSRLAQIRVGIAQVAQSVSFALFFFLSLMETI